MADLSISSDSSTQALEIAQNAASEARAKSGKHVTATAAVTPLAVDSVASTQPTTANKAAVNADAPMLPDPTGAAASPRETMRAVAGSKVFASGGDGLFAALESMTNARQKDMNNAMLLKRLQGQDQVSAKVQEMKDKQAEINGNIKSADTVLAGSMAGLLLTAKLTQKGSEMERTPNRQLPDNATEEQRAANELLKEKDKLEASDRQSKGAMYRNIGMNAAGTVTAATDMLDINVGGKHEANDAALAQKQDAVQGQIYQNNEGSASSWLDQAKDQRKSAQQAITSHVQMWSEAVNNVFK